jgi:hypothetical protein
MIAMTTPRTPKVIVNSRESDVSVAAATVGGGEGVWVIGSNDMAEDDAGIDKTDSMRN